MAARVFNVSGVSQIEYFGQQESHVAVYYHESYSSTIVLASFPMFDRARQGTRGPQGALCERNASGGVVQFTWIQGTKTCEGRARATNASFD